MRGKDSAEISFGLCEIGRSYSNDAVANCGSSWVMQADVDRGSWSISAIRYQLPYAPLPVSLGLLSVRGQGVRRWPWDDGRWKVVVKR